MSHLLFCLSLLTSLALGAWLGWPQPGPVIPAIPPPPTAQTKVLQGISPLAKASLAGSEAWSRTLETTARENPAAAGAWLAQAAFSPQIEQGVQTVGSFWAETNPQQALAWAASLGHERLRSAALVGLFSRWAQLDAPAAWKASETHPGASQTVAASWATEDFSAAWKQLGNSEHSTTLLTHAGPQTPVATLEKIFPSLTSAKLGELGTAPWVRLAERSPAAARLAWQALPADEPSRPAIRKSLADTWPEQE